MLIEKREVLGLKKSPDPNAKIAFKIQAILLSEVDNMRLEHINHQHLEINLV